MTSTFIVYQGAMVEEPMGWLGCVLYSLTTPPVGHLEEIDQFFQRM